MSIIVDGKMPTSDEGPSSFDQQSSTSNEVHFLSNQRPYTCTHDDTVKRNASSQESEDDLPVQQTRTAAQENRIESAVCPRVPETYPGTGEPERTLCSFLILSDYNGKPSYEGRDKKAEFLFHSSCGTCPSQPGPELLCVFCQHLRLYHLLACLQSTLERLWMNLDETTTRSWLAINTKNRDCKFCRIMANAVRSCLIVSGEDKIAWRDISILLELNQSTDGGSFKALLWGTLHGSNGLLVYAEVPFTRIPSQLNTTPCFPDERPESPHTPFAPKPIVEDWISWDRMRKWIPDHQRGYEKSKDSKHFPSGFRLIHVKDRRVISIIEPGTKFVALSYVWGACVEEEDGLLEDNKAEFEKPDGLKRLPRGIEDAIKICQKLDYLYLWVDRYCIIQDEGHPEKQDQINAMAVIYSSAELTLINASGSSMHEPIPGVTTNRKSLQSKETMFGFEFTNAYPDFRSLLKNTTWFKRGWTYQEAVLSRRKLIFTPFETFFEDSQGGWDLDRREDKYSRQRGGATFYDQMMMIHFRLHSNIKGTTTFDDFVPHLESYTTRSLTHQSDILNAFAGIMTSLYDGNMGLYGLPEIDFDQAMLWSCSEARPDGPVLTRPGFPSWSWASASEKVRIPAIRSYLAFKGTLVRWAYKDQNGELLPVKSHFDLDESHSPQLALLVAWWKGCLEAVPPEIMQQKFQEVSEDCKSEILARWPRLEDVWNEIRDSRRDVLETYRDYNIGLKQADQGLADQLQPGVLITRAQTAFFKVSKAKDYYWQTDNGLDVINSEGKSIGRVYTEHLRVTEDATLEINSNKTGGSFEFMAISLSQWKHAFGRDDWEWGSDDREMGEFCVTSGIRAEGLYKSWPAVNVLLIDSSEETSFARRISAGWIFLEDWVHAERVFKTICLE